MHTLFQSMDTLVRHGLSRASFSLVRNVCTFNSTGEGFLPRADSGYSRDLLSRDRFMLLLFSVTSAAEKMFYDTWVCQSGDISQILVIFGNLP